MKKFTLLFVALLSIMSMSAATETVYFVNANNWTGTIKAHLWGGTANGTSWNGNDMTKESEQIAGFDVYSYSAEAGAYANVIFNNGSAQTTDLTWTAGKYYVKDGWYTKDEAVVKLGQPIEYETVYFVDAYEWGSANIYTWQPEVKTWPGVEMTKESEQIAGYDVYSYTVEKGTSFGGMLFNGDGNQTINLTWTAGKYYVKDGWYTKDEAVVKLGQSIEYDTVYFVDAYKWGSANIYTWTPEVGSWPGKAMTKESEQIAGYDVYSYTVEKGTSFGGLNFNCGDSKKTDDLTWTAGKYYVKDGWYTKEEAEKGLVPSVKLAGTLSSWDGTLMELSDDYKTASLTLTLDAKEYELKIIEEGTWFGNAGTMKRGNSSDWTFSSDVNDNCKITADVAGEYVFTWTFETDKLTVVYPSNSVEPDPEPTTYTVNFDNTNSGWEKVYAYCWNGEGDAAVANAAWPGVELTNPENNVYTYSTTTAYENVIFNAGEGKVQTANLVFENGKTYSIDVAYVLGTVNYERIANDECWSVDFAEHKMTYDANTGIWTKTYTNLPAGDYEFKLYCGIWLNSVVVDSVSSTPGFKYDNPGDNISFTLSDVATVTITYNSMLNTFAIVGQGIDEFGELVVTSYTLCGSKAIFGGEKDFDETLTKNDMTGKDGVWTKTYEAVQLEAYNEETLEGVRYEYKVAANHKWNGAAYPSAGGYVVLWVATAGKYNLTFTYEPNKAEDEKLTVEIQPLAAPVVTLTESAYFVDNFEVVVTCEGKDADTKVYYQIGEAEALEYTAESVKITETSTIKAWSERYGQKSEVVVATYTKLNQPQLPESATFEDTKEIVITGAMVKYTLNGGEVKDYTAPFTIAETTTVVAWAQAGDLKTAEVSVTYTKQEVVVPEGPKVVTIAEFLAAEVNAEVWYELIGVITDIKSADYGNVTIKDETGSVYIYGLTKTQVSSNDKSFASLDLVVNDTVTLRTVRGEFNGEVQGGGKTTPAYYVSHKDYVAPEQPEALVEYVDEQGRIVYPFANVPEFNSWGNSYVEHVVEYNDATVTFEGASRQTTNIKDIPVTKGKYVQLTLKDATKAITSVRLVCRQWTTKAQTITLNAGVSEAGLAATEVTSSNFVLETNELPTNSTVIRFTFSSTSDQIGIDSIYYTVGDKVAVAVEQPTVSVVGGEKYEAFVVELACATVDAKVYYTLNGGEKTEYTAPIKISENTELKTWAELGENVSDEIVVNYTFPAQVADIAALIADETGENVCIAATLTVIAQTGKYLWVEDASMSMLVFGEAPATYKNGDQLTGLVGKAKVYNGAKQITPAYFPEVATGTPVEPTVIALADVTAATVHQYIKLEDVTYTNATTLTAGDNTLAMYDRFGYTYAGEEGDKVDVIAIAGLHNKTVQVYPISIEKVAIVEPTTFTVYFENTENWSTVNAYCWQTESGDKNAEWPGEAMTPVEGHDGFYSYTTTTAYDNIIFNNGDGVKTKDLTFPEDNNNVFTINGNDEDGKKTGTWTVYVAPDPNKPVVSFTNLNATAELGATIKPEATAKNIENPTFVYTVSYEGGEAVTLDEKGYSLNDYGVYEFTVVATGDNDVTATATFTVTVELVAVLGSAELCHGYYWTENIKNAMYPVDGIYTITYEDVPVGTYEFKVAFGRSFMFGIENIDSVNSTKGFNGTNNISFTLSEVTDIKISYNPETGKVTLVGVGLEQFAEFVATSYTLCGSKVIFGDEFNTTLTANDMVETSTGVWTKTYSNVVLEAGVYLYKVAANYAWNVGQYPASGDANLDIKEAGNYNLTFKYEPNKVEGEKLTCVVEKINQGPTTEVENGTIANIYTQNGLIVVEGEYQIFTITGQNVTQMNGNLIRGVYIVRTANATSKVIIK